MRAHDIAFGQMTQVNQRIMERKQKMRARRAARKGRAKAGRHG